MECYNITGESDDNDPLKINIPNSEGICIVDGASITTNQFLKPRKIKKVKTGSNENPKFDNIGDYWDGNTVGNITVLLHAFQYMFPTIFFLK